MSAKASLCPSDAKERKNLPVARGVIDYFPLALLAVAHVSKIGNDQHNPGEPLHWARSKSTDHADCIVRHLIDRGKFDIDGLRHTAKLAWRALALLQEELESIAIAPEELDGLDPIEPGPVEVPYVVLPCSGGNTGQGMAGQ